MARPDVQDITISAADRHFDRPGVREYLADLSVDQLAQLLRGEPDRVTIYSDPPGKAWHVGDGRPQLASEDIATQQAIARCAASRIRDRMPVPRSSDHVDIAHPEPCDWCLEDTRDLMAACEWAWWWQRVLTADLFVWRNANDRHISYVRATGYDGPTNPRVVEWLALTPADREARVQEAIARGQRAAA